MRACSDRTGEAGAHDRLRGFETRSMAGDDGDEQLPVEGPQLQRLECAHGRRSRHVAQQRDLTEEATRPELADLGAVRLDHRTTGVDDVEPVAVASLLEDRGHRLDLHRHEPGREPLELRRP